MQKHYSLNITGKVQGVFFRQNTKEKADELGIKGYVRNESDGSVHIECEGEGEYLEKFLAWCHKGPQRAHVDHVKMETGELKNYTSFKIDRS